MSKEELINISEQIKKHISTIDKLRNTLRVRAEAKAETNANYEKALAKTIIGLKLGETYKLDDKSIENPPATVMEKLARGLCWQEKLKADKAESAYKSAIVALDSLKTQINALQSILKYLEEI